MVNPDNPLFTLTLIGVPTRAHITGGSAIGFGRTLDTTNVGAKDRGAVANVNAALDLNATSNVDSSPAYRTQYLADYVGEDGAFTFEAIIKPIALRNPSTGGFDNHMDIIMMDSGGSRAFQFRINKNGTLQWDSLGSGGGDLAVALPSSGLHAYVPGAWYHAAATYNGDPSAPNNFILYWTKLDSGVTEAQVLGQSTWKNALTQSGATQFSVGNEARGKGEECMQGFIDEVRVSSIARNAADMIVGSLGAYNPTPVDGEIDVDPAAVSQISWNVSKASNVTGQYLYFTGLSAGSEPNFAGVSPVSISAAFDPSVVATTLSMDKTYCWRVDTSVNGSLPDANETLTGTVWTFNTLKSVPVILDQPANTAVFTSQTASFAVTFNSLSSPEVAWYRVSNPATPLSGVTLTNLGGELYITELQIPNVQASHEDDYYCAITNAGTATPATSVSAMLIVKRLVTYYPFDGTTQDVIGIADGTAYGSPGYVSGVPNFGQAIYFNGTSQYVLIDPNEQYPKPGPSGAFETGTISLWVSVDVQAAEMHPFGAYMGPYGGGPAYDLWFNSSATDITFRLRPNSGTYEVSPSAFTTYAGDGKWHLITITYEKGIGMEMFLDGNFVAASGYTANPVFDPWTVAMAIGAQNTRGIIDRYFHGAIDDFRIYNYRLALSDIRALYRMAFPEAWWCDVSYESDFDGDCQVGLSDLFLILSEWLSCGRYPQEACF
jgi:hypothetical protein